MKAVCPYHMRDRTDDLVQAGIMAVMRIVRNEGNREFPSSYLRRVAYSALIDEIRRLRRRNETPIPETGMGPELVDEFPRPDHQARAREIGKAIRECLMDLIQPRRIAVTLHLLGHKVPEIARKTGWKGKRASNLLYRGLDDLRACLRMKEVTP